MFQTAVPSLPATGEPRSSTGIRTGDPERTGPVMEGEDFQHLFIQHLLPSFKNIKIIPVVKNREIMCSSFFLSFIFLFFSFPFFFFKHKKNRRFRTIGKAWEGSLVLESSFSAQYFCPASPQTLVLSLHLPWLHTQWPLLEFPKLLEKLRHSNCRISPSLQQLRQNLTYSPPSRPEPPSPAATNGIKNTDYLSEKNNINQASQNNTTNLKQA